MPKKKEVPKEEPKVEEAIPEATKEVVEEVVEKPKKKAKVVKTPVEETVVDSGGRTQIGIVSPDGKSVMTREGVAFALKGK